MKFAQSTSYVRQKLLNHCSLYYKIILDLSQVTSILRACQGRLDYACEDFSYQMIRREEFSSKPQMQVSER
jgi:hypothetical protein